MVMALAGFASAEMYTDQYDNINVDEILENKKLLVAYIKCVLDQGRCVPEGKELKGINFNSPLFFRIDDRYVIFHSSIFALISVH